MSDHDTDGLAEGVDEVAAASVPAESPEEIALRQAEEAAAEAQAKLIEARAVAARAAARPKDRETAVKLVELADAQLAEKEKPGQDLDHAKHDLATARTALVTRPTGITDDDWDTLRTSIEKRIPDLEKAVEAALVEVQRLNISAGEISHAAQVVHEARSYLDEFDAA